ncbi:MAG: hypothetical protein KDA69_08130 [Planctomycetaceae bacterium]|nr:hypothetical protein [Planctomycetaceae bacterium]MCA9044272.1 hypothetical protein [Planctomycetaceae bacterium]MCB9949692.1 hypothetical protein [Planctomycetaceae bacterium]
MSDRTTKVVLFGGVTLVAITIAAMVVRPAWLTYVTGTLLLAFAGLGYSASPAGTGHVADGVLSYLIMAALLVLSAASVGHGIANHGGP